uniref:Uncharacterized protein n=1 Tax=Zea mays TaxID=4577 RepID=C0PM01_MAIZE|nr:unknown [Zea mays]
MSLFRAMRDCCDESSRSMNKRRLSLTATERITNAPPPPMKQTTQTPLRFLRAQTVPKLASDHAAKPATTAAATKKPATRRAAEPGGDAAAPGTDDVAGVVLDPVAGAVCPAGVATGAPPAAAAPPLQLLTSGVVTLHASGRPSARVRLTVRPSDAGSALSATHRHCGSDCTTLPSCAQHDGGAADTFPEM